MAPKTILVVNEHEEIELPQKLIASDGYVDAFKEALERDYFSIRLKKGKLILQAGGYVGRISVNESLALDIRPKVPLGNLERVLALAKSQVIQLNSQRRTYNTSKFSPKSVSDFLWTEFLEQAEYVHELGFQKKYIRVIGSRQTPRGKIAPFKSRLQSARYGRPVAECSWQERSIDTGPNRLILYLLSVLHNSLIGSADRAMKRRVTYCLSLYEHIPFDAKRNFLSDPEVRDPEIISQTKDHYRGIVKIGKLILEGQGLAFLESSASGIDATSLLINMDIVFEDYIRNTLEQSQELKKAGLDILDGNKGGDRGGKKPLLTTTDHPFQSEKEIIATPDVVLKSLDPESKKNVVIDVKYKRVQRTADRSDINQIIAYACSYDASAAVLIFPFNDNENRILCLGAFGKTKIFQYFVDLTNPDIEREGEMLSTALIEMLD